MSRANDPNEYVLRVNLKHGSDARRFCEVRVKGNDVYVYQPKKGNPVKVSYHESGEQHVKVGSGLPIMQLMQLDPTEVIWTEETPWSQSFENFNDLLPYTGQIADDTFEIELALSPPLDSITFAEIAIGRSFGSKEWTMEGVEHNVLNQKVFAVPQSINGLQVCVRVLRLRHSP